MDTCTGGHHGGGRLSRRYLVSTCRSDIGRRRFDATWVPDPRSSTSFDLCLTSMERMDSRCISALLMGLSYSWWMAKHNSHHANPNKEDADPDVHSTVLVLTPGATIRRRGFPAEISRFQRWFFLPLLCFEGLNLHVASLKMLLFTSGVRHRIVELLMIIARHSALAVFLLAYLPPGKTLAFLGVQLVVFGVMLGGAFALNHIGMPTVPRGVHLDFLRRQVLMSRNISDGPLIRFLMDGLQYQLEHHLFPIIPAPTTA